MGSAPWGRYLILSKDDRGPTVSEGGGGGIRKLVVLGRLAVREAHEWED